MKKKHFLPCNSAETFEPDILAEPFCESQRSKSKEHTDRFVTNKILRKTQKIEGIES